MDRYPLPNLHSFVSQHRQLTGISVNILQCGIWKPTYSKQHTGLRTSKFRTILSTKTVMMVDVP